MDCVRDAGDADNRQAAKSTTANSMLCRKPANARNGSPTSRATNEGRAAVDSDLELGVGAAGMA